MLNGYRNCTAVVCCKTCFLPDEHTDMLRTLVRHRRSLTQDSTRYVLRMQKALESMNIKIHTVINDITGKTGTAILKAIIAGERDPNSFLSYVDPRIKADKQSILKSLEGNWRSDHLFLLTAVLQSISAYADTD